MTADAQITDDVIVLAVVTISAVVMLALGSHSDPPLEARAERIDRKLACRRDTA